MGKSSLKIEIGIVPWGCRGFSYFLGLFQVIMANPEVGNFFLPCDSQGERRFNVARDDDVFNLPHRIHVWYIYLQFG